MLNLCTVSDKSYLAQGLTLFESLQSTTDDFILHYLCIDDESYECLSKFTGYGGKNMRVWHVNELTSNDPVPS
jgi:hypothetical protein